MKRGGLGRNLVSNIVFFALNIFISLWLVSYLVRELGVAAFGLIPLANTIASYFNVITAGLNAAVGRHMTVAISRGIPSEVGAIYNSSLLASGVVALLMCLLSVPMIDGLAYFIDVPLSFERDAGWLFFLVVASLAITTFGTPFQTVIYSLNRFDLQNVGNIFGLLLKVVSIFLLFKLFHPQLWQVGVSVMCGALATLFVVMWASKCLAPEIRFRVSDFSWSVVRKVSGTGGWIFVGQVGTLLLVSIDLLVANVIISAAAAGQYALVLQWSLLLRNLAMTVSGVFGPTMVRLHAEGRFDELVLYARQSVRAVGLGMAIPIGIVCGFSKSILIVWLGADFSDLAPLMIIATWHLSLNLAYLPLHGISMAANKVKIPGLMQIVSGGLNLVFAILLARIIGLFGIAIAGGIVLLARNIIFTPIYSARILERPNCTFLFDSIPGFVLSISVFSLSWAGSLLFQPDSWFLLIFYSGLCGVLGVGILWVFLLRDNERNILESAVRKMVGYRR